MTVAINFFNITGGRPGRHTIVTLWGVETSVTLCDKGRRGSKLAKKALHN